MRYAELEGNRVRYVLPAERAGEYAVLPPNAVEIAIDEDVREGDVFDPAPGTFRRKTDEELKAEALPGFDAERDRLFRETEWVRQRHEDRVFLGIDDTVNWTAWLGYWQALRDIPEQAEFDPRAPVWPERPE